MKKNNIVLIGYRGTGKSTVGRILAEQLGLELIGLDAAIVELAGRDIPAIVAEHGWDHFRDLETKVVEQSVSGTGRLLDCGGGVILRPENVKLLKAAGPVFWLKASIDTVIERIKDGTDRPSLTGEKSFVDEVAQVLEERLPLYRAAADYEVDTDGKLPEQIAREISEYFAKG